MRNSRTNKNVYMELKEDIQMIGDKYGSTYDEISEDINEAHRLGLITGVQYERLKDILNGGDGSFE